MIEWIKYINQKPIKKGKYLWALNNWKSRNINNERVHTSSVDIHYFENDNWWGDGNHGIIRPDYWAEIPYPTKEDRPTDDLKYEI